MFPCFVSRQSLSLFLAKNHIFKQILPIHGAIVECGFFMGGGLFTWAQLSSIYKPANHNRRIIGFDSFEGFPQVGSQDDGADLIHKIEGGYCFNDKKELKNCADYMTSTVLSGISPKSNWSKGMPDRQSPIM